MGAPTFSGAMAREAWTLLIFTIGVLLVVQPGVSPASGSLGPEAPTGDSPLERIPDAEAIRDTIAETTSQLPDSLPRDTGPSSALDNASQALPLVDAEQPMLPELPDPKLPEDRQTSPPPAVRAEGSTGQQTQSDSRQDHHSIVIVGDQGPTGFEIAPGVPRPGSGVRGGSGTAEDPYVISDWNVSGIRIVNTDAHVRIQTNTLTPPPEPIAGPPLPPGSGLYGQAAALANGLYRVLDQDAALLLENADNVTVAHNLFVGEEGRVQASGSDRLSVLANEFEDAGRAIQVRGGEDVSLEDHVFPQIEASEYPPVLARRVQDLAVDGNDFAGEGVGVALIDGSGAQVTDNRFAVADLATVADGTENARAANNTFTGGVGFVHTDSGDSLVEDNEFEHVLAAAVAGTGTELSMHNNTVQNSTVGLFADDGSAGSAADNDVDGAHYGVLADGTSKWTIAENNVTGSVYASALVDADSTLAENNFTDNVIGTLVEGQGGHVTANTYQGELFGVLLFDARQTHVEGNHLETEGVGLLAAFGEQADLVDNTVPTGAAGGVLKWHSQAHLSGNSFQGHGLSISASQPDHARHTIDATNELNGEPIRYVRDATGATVTEPAGQVLLAQTTDVHVDNVTVENATVGVHSLFSTGTRIANTTVSESFYGVYGYVSPEITVENSEFLAAPDSGPFDARFGLLALDAPRSEIRDTRFEGPSYASLLLEAEDSRITGSDVADAELGHLVLAGDNADVRNNSLGADVYNVALVGSPQGTLRDNAFANGSLYVSNSDPTEFFGTVPGSYDQDIDASNTVNGEALRYRAHAVDTGVASPAGQIFLANTTDVRVQNHTIENTTLPVFAVDSTNFTVRDSRLNGSIAAGAVLTDGVAVHNNSIAASTIGVLAGDVLDTSITENTLAGTGPESLGVYGVDAPDLRASNNTVQGFPYGITVFGTNAKLNANTMEDGGIVLAPLAGQTLEANTVNGQPVRYLDGAEDRTVTEPAGQVLIADSHNVTARGLDVSASSVGVYAYNSSEVSVEQVEAGDQPYGILLADSPDSLVRETTVQNATSYGVVVAGSPGSRAVDNRISGPANATTRAQGIGVYASANLVTVRHNTFEDHLIGLSFSPGDSDKEATVAEANEIRNNTLGIDAFFVSKPPEIHYNNIHGNELAGLLGGETNTPDATHNWWGCSGGPSQDACDDVLGHAFVDPWLTEANPDAGAGGDGSTTATTTASDDGSQTELEPLADAGLAPAPEPSCRGSSALVADLPDLGSLGSPADDCESGSLGEARLGPRILR